MKKLMVVIMVMLMLLSVVVVHANTENSNTFVDVTNTDWYYSDVQYVQNNKLMTGTSETEFSPSGATTRGMIVTILWRVEGEPVVEGKDFEDVAPDEWYSKAVAWASNNQIVSGYSETEFGPNDTATREQLATIMYRYASYKKCDLSKKADLDKYKDKDEISYYAVESIEWANANGIISGTSETTISPKDNVLRSQVAAILRRFCEKFEIFKDIENEENTESEKEENKEEINNIPVGGGGSLGAGGFGDEPEDENVNDNKPEDVYIPEEDPQRPTLNVNATYGNPGEYVTVVVDLENNPGILGMILQIEFDEEAMTLVGVENGEAVSGVLSLTTSKELMSGTKFVWDGLEITPDQIKDGQLMLIEFMLSENVIHGKRYPLSITFNAGDIIDYNFSSVNPLVKQGFIEINQEDYQ